MRAIILIASAIASALALGACEIAEKVDAGSQYQKSVADYRACLDANPNNTQACESKRISMEVEERVYNNLSAGVAHGDNATANVNIQSQ